MSTNEDIQKNEALEPPVNKDPSSSRLIITLALAGLVAGILISGVNLYTQPMIRANKAMALRKAIFQVLPGCTDYQPLILDNGKLKEIEPSEGVSNPDIPQTIFAGYDETEALVGLALVAQEPGFQDIVSGIFGYDPIAKIIVGFEVLESKETPGLGDKIIKDPGFRENFTALATEPEITGVKQGQKQKANEVEMITGATISSKTVVRLLNKGLGETKHAMEAFAKEKSTK